MSEIGVADVRIRETELTEGVLQTLIALSEDWEAEQSCHGYRKNGRPDIEGNRIFLAEEEGRVIGYLFGAIHESERMTSVMPEKTAYFEVEELYVVPEFRSKGVGSALFRRVEQAVKPDAAYLLVSTATKNWRAILHFYIEELGMDFWSARLCKKL